KGLENLKQSMSKAVEKGKMQAEQMNGCLLRISLSWDMKDIKDSDIVIEAVPEELKLKVAVFKDMEKFSKKDAILATNTSSISIDKIAASVKSPSRVVGLHFFNPVPIMKLVEIVRGDKTSDDTFSKAKDFAEHLGKIPVMVKNSPGFVSNRILMLFINEAVKTLEDKVATKEGIDNVARMGFNHPMGPLELADLIGLDVCKDIMDAIYEQMKDEKFKPAKLLNDLVRKGKLGKKSGEGFYNYKN
ncbi:MAG TPA: 3-hydroxyacyl-CoA dehydrogenase NAD-binding domain-containing protein, partial [archaeon]|nr:3-hydroxyacyl-CoA dehydrogenase NAD-binding domain-containing protein [archaeon]